MKRTLLFATCVYCGGIVIGSVVECNPLFILILALLFLFASIFLLIRGRKIFCLIYLTIICLGVLSSAYKLVLIQEQNSRFESQSVLIEGQISEDIEIKGKTAVYTVYIDSIYCRGALYSYHGKIKVIDYKNDFRYIKPFNRVKLSGKFTGWKPYKNMYYSYCDRFMIKDNINAALLADYTKDLASSPCSERSFLNWMHNIRSGVESRIDTLLEPESSALLKGMLFGDTSYIDEDNFESFRKAGIVHIFSVSGYNIWLIYFLLSIMLSFLKSENRLKTILIILMLGLYTAMSGGTPSVVRAYIMVVILLLGRMIKRKADPITSLSLAALVILILDPLSVMDIGFQLSFVSVASLIVLLPKLNGLKLRIPGKIKDLLMTSLAVQIGIVPIIAFNFNSISIISLLSNLLLIPVSSLFMILGIAICIISLVSIGLSSVFAVIINNLGAFITWTANLVNTIPYSNLNVVSPNMLEIAIYYLIIVLVFKVINFNRKYMKAEAFIIAVLILTVVITGIMPSELKICFIDVGQGDSMLICTPDKKHILIDGGGKPESQYSGTDIGADVLKPYLYRHGIKKIDIMISTHGHDDHLKGLIPVMRSFDVGLFVKSETGEQKAYEELLNKGYLRDANVMDVDGGDIIRIGEDLKLYVISPEGEVEDENDSSIVIKLVYKDFTAMLTGDISSKIEKGLVSKQIKSDLLKIPHHGSSASLYIPFLDEVSPKAAVICVGENNYGHPSDAVVEGLVDKGIDLYRTDKDGEIIITTRGKGFKVNTAI